MSNFSSYPTRSFSETQKFFVLDPQTGTPSFVLGSDLVNQLTPNSNYVFAESTRATAQATDYPVGQLVQTAGAVTAGDGLASGYLVVPSGDGDFPMDNGNELLVISGDDALREQLISNASGEGSDLVAHTGTTDTVTEALDKRTIYVGSVADMISAPLVIGSKVSTLGYYSAGDGGGNSYEIVAGATGTADGGSFIDLDNGLQAKGLFTSGVYVKQFGAKGDGVTNDRAFIQNGINYLKSGGGTLVFNPDNNYYVTGHVGTDVTDLTDYADNVTLRGYGSTITIDGSVEDAVVVLEGNNVAALGLSVTSQRSIDYQADLTPQRTPYQHGIVVGGKGYSQSPRSDGALDQFKNKARIEDCVITNMNLPLVLFRAAEGVVSRNLVDQFTDTGILLDDCTTDVEVTDNKCTRGGDDNMFIRHYPNSPWATSLKYIGRYVVTGNNFRLTFGKNFGAGGVSDLLVSNNIFSDSWAGGMNLEVNSWAQNSPDYNKRVLFDGNMIINSGRNYHTSEPVVEHQSVYPDLEQAAAIHTKYRNDRTGEYFREVTITNNVIINPRAYGISLKAVDKLTVLNNTIAAGLYDHGAGNVGTSNAAILVQELDNIAISNNRIFGEGVNFPYCYELDSTDFLTGVRVFDNHQQFGTAVFLADAGAQAVTTYRNQDSGAFDGQIRSDGSGDRFSYIGTGAGSNFLAYHKLNWPLRLYNSGGDMLLQTNDSGTAAGNVGIAVGGQPSRRLHVTGPTGAPAVRLDNSNVNNGTVSINLGSVGPTGASTGDPVGFLQIDIGGITRYMPFW